jgi:hypothetical protein
MRARVIQVCQCGLLGWVLVMFGAVAVLGWIGIVASWLGVHSVSLAIGPVGLMSAHSGADGYGFQTEWGVGAAAYVGAFIGILYGLRVDRRHMRAIREE